MPGNGGLLMICTTRTSSSFAAICVLCATGTMAATKGDPADPARVVVAAIKLEQVPGAVLHDDRPGGPMRRYFTKGFMTSWSAALAHNKDRPFLDGDLISGYQTVKSLTIRRIHTDSLSEAQASVTTTLFVQLGAPPLTLDVRFSLKREAGTWKIDDISNKVVPSLHNFLNKASHY